MKLWFSTKISGFQFQCMNCPLHTWQLALHAMNHPAMLPCWRVWWGRIRWIGPILWWKLAWCRRPSLRPWHELPCLLGSLFTCTHRVLRSGMPACQSAIFTTLNSWGKQIKTEFFSEILSSDLHAASGSAVSGETSWSASSSPNSWLESKH